MRGFHILVRDYDMNVINSEYGTIGPFEDSPKENGKVMWYRPNLYMRPTYRMGMELEPEFKMPRPKNFKIHEIDDKRSVYFQRIKKS